MFFENFVSGVQAPPRLRKKKSGASAFRMREWARPGLWGSKCGTVCWNSDSTWFNLLHNELFFFSMNLWFGTCVHHFGSISVADLPQKVGLESCDRWRYMEIFCSANRPSLRCLRYRGTIKGTSPWILTLTPSSTLTQKEARRYGSRTFRKGTTPQHLAVIGLLSFWLMLSSFCEYLCKSIPGIPWSMFLLHESFRH